MYQYPVLFPAFSNREDLLLTVSLFDDDTGDPLELSGRTLANPGDFTGSVWTVTDGAIVTSSTTSLTIPDFPIGGTLLAVSAEIGIGLGILAGDPITFADPTGLNTMTGYVTSYAPTTGVVVFQVGTAFEFEIRHIGPRDYHRTGYSVFYDIGTYPSLGPIITAQLGNGLTIIGVGVMQILIPAMIFQKLHLSTYLASMNMTDSINTRQVFVGQLPVEFGGVGRAAVPNPGAAAWEAIF